MEKKLYRNEHNKVLAGVSSGLEDYMQIDATVIRIVFILSTIFTVGVGLIVYIVMWIILPVKNDPRAKYTQFNEYFKNNPSGFSSFNQPQSFSGSANAGESTKWNTENVSGNKTPPDFSKLSQPNDSSKTIIGMLFLVVGIFFFMKQMGWFPFYLAFHFRDLVPIAIILIGIGLLFKTRQKEDWTNFYKTHPEQAPKETPTEKPKNTENQEGQNA